ncbi:hypothetical protein [Thermogemmatispora tikiterensis]|uniref:Uncharacterized protein n=1 Tax=Thermogemmatispora tikiterensis TaxID=1825093 RepID=A0A328VKA1_9CHLR|nr:hypothetical protein [Thermogemmatispora tikiterensis]RAQ97539.1 hypothetical protein A4R35_18525 [Thermogemmatispora tikiterensis]
MSAIRARFDRYDLVSHQELVVGRERLAARARRLRACLLAQEEELLPVLLETLAAPPRQGSASVAFELLQEMGLPAQVEALPVALNYVGDRNGWAWIDAATFLQRVPVEEVVPHVIAALLWPWEPYHGRYTTGETTWKGDVYGIHNLLWLPGTDRGVVRGCVEVIYYQLLCHDLRTCRSQSWREGERLYWLETQLRLLERAGVQGWMVPGLIGVMKHYPGAEELERARRLLRELPKEERRGYRGLLEGVGEGELVGVSSEERGGNEGAEGGDWQEELLVRLQEVVRGPRGSGEEREVEEIARELGAVGRERGAGLVYVGVVWELEEERMREGEPVAEQEGRGGRELGGWLRVLERVGVEPWMAPALVEVVRRYRQREEGELARGLLGGLPKEELRRYREVLRLMGLGELADEEEAPWSAGGRWEGVAERRQEEERARRRKGEEWGELGALVEDYVEAYGEWWWHGGEREKGRLQELKERLREEGERAVEVLAALLGDRTQTERMTPILVLLQELGYPWNAKALAGVLRLVGDPEHERSVFTLLWGVPVEELLPQLLAALLVPGRPYHWEGDEREVGEAAGCGLSSYDYWVLDVYGGLAGWLREPETERELVERCGPVAFYLLSYEVEQWRRRRVEREDQRVAEDGSAGVEGWLRVLERAGVQPWMAPALVEVARQWPKAWKGEVARQLLGRLPKEELRPYGLLLRRAGLGELVGRQEQEPGGQEAERLWKLESGVEEEGEEVREELRGIAGEEQVPYVVEALLEPEGAGEERRREQIGRLLERGELEDSVVEGCRAVVYYLLAWELEERRRRELDPLAQEEEQQGRERWSRTVLERESVLWLRVLERAGVESWMAPGLVEVVRRYPQREEGEVARRLLGRLPKEELRRYRLILEQSELGELGS